MLVFLKLAWRNMLRNKRRTILSSLAIGLGLAGLIFVDALWIGMERNMIHTATASFLGEGQIHRKGYRETQEMEQTIERLDEVLAQLEREPIVRHFSRRVFAFGMISSAANVSAITLVGVDPVAEKPLSQIDDAITQGTFFEGTSERDIIIGSNLAELLEVGLGDRVVVTAAQYQTGDLAQEMLRVSGIYHFNVREMDSGFAFIRLTKAQQMLGLGDRVHEIAIQFTRTELGQDKSLPFWEKFSRYGNEAVGWTTILPQLETVFKLTDFSIYITGLILFGVVVFGIINTLFMSLYERMFEFGVLRAIGTRPTRMALLIVLEAAVLAAFSIVVGCLLGLGVTYLTSKTGIDYRGIEFAGVTMRELIYPVLRLKQFVFYPFWLLVFTVLTGMYPAIHAARLSPAKAMRRSF